jgi:hypothetical protein
LPIGKITPGFKNASCIKPRVAPIRGGGLFMSATVGDLHLTSPVSSHRMVNGAYIQGNA